jgi:hypothetical protein
VNPAGCHGRFFWRVISAGYFGAFIWRVFMASKTSGFLEEKKSKEKERKSTLSSPVKLHYDHCM